MEVTVKGDILSDDLSIIILASLKQAENQDKIQFNTLYGYEFIKPNLTTRGISEKQTSIKLNRYTNTKRTSSYSSYNREG